MEITASLADLEAWANANYKVNKQCLMIAGQQYQFYTIADIDAVIDEVLTSDENPDENAPYWAELWPSALALANFVSRLDDVANKNAIELGCGLGLSGIVLNSCGGNAVLTDFDENALRFAALNGMLNLKRPPDVKRLDWRYPPENEGYDIILAADVAYEKRLFKPFIGTIEALLNPDGILYLSEPNRSIAKTFFQLLESHSFQWENFSENITLNEITSVVSVYKITRE